MADNEIPDSLCSHTACLKVDKAPKMHVLEATNQGLDWTVAYHHDCARLLGYETAAIIVEKTNGAKDDALRACLTNLDHPVHAAVAEFHEKQAQEIDASNKRQLGE